MIKNYPLHRFDGNNAWYLNDNNEVVVIPDHNGRFVFPLKEIKEAIKAVSAHNKSDKVKEQKEEK